jgi:hypothetical protein
LLLATQYTLAVDVKLGVTTVTIPPATVTGLRLVIATGAKVVVPVQHCTSIAWVLATRSALVLRVRLVTAPALEALTFVAPCPFAPRQSMR